MFEIVEDSESQVKVSFFVYSSLAALARSDIKLEWRSLEFLR